MLATAKQEILLKKAVNWEDNKDRSAYTINTPFLAAKPDNGFTCYFPMPFSSSARIEIENDSGRESGVYYIIDWHAYPEAELEEKMRFCDRWRYKSRIRPTGAPDMGVRPFRGGST